MDWMIHRVAYASTLLNLLIRGKSGFPAIAPGDLEESEILYRIVSREEDDRMPPKGDALKPEQIKLLRQWISSGANYAKHWAYVVPQRPALPRVENKNFVRTPVDQFILSKLEQKEWVPSEPAKKEKWIRRVSLGLTGLPPTLEEFENFMQDNSPKAREKVVDRLLAFPDTANTGHANGWILLGMPIQMVFRRINYGTVGHFVTG